MIDLNPLKSLAQREEDLALRFLQYFIELIATLEKEKVITSTNYNVNSSGSKFKCSLQLASLQISFDKKEKVLRLETHKNSEQSAILYHLAHNHAPSVKGVEKKDNQLTYQTPLFAAKHCLDITVGTYLRENEVYLENLKQINLLAQSNILEPGQELSINGDIFGYFVRKHTFTDENGIIQEWNLIMAPEDLTNKKGKVFLNNYNNSQKQLASKSYWHGAHGGNYKNENELKSTFEKNAYHGEWFVPTAKMMHSDDEEKPTMTSISDELPKQARLNNKHNEYYYSSTEENSTHIKALHISELNYTTDDKDSYTQKTRPVRAVKCR